MPAEEDGFNYSQPTAVVRTGSIVTRPSGPWTPSTHAFLRHLRSKGFTECPEPVDGGFDEEGNEVLTWVEGSIVHPAPWEDGPTVLGELGAILKQLHDAAATFEPPADARWLPWTLHRPAGPDTVVSHGNIAPWHVVLKDGHVSGLIGWEYAGHVDPLEEVAVTAWYCCHLADDEVAELVGLPSAEVRAHWLRCFLDGYGLDAADRSRIVPSILEFSVMDNAWFARGKNITPEQNDLTAEDVWLLSWQTRAAAWVLEHRALLEEAIGAR